MQSHFEINRYSGFEPSQAFDVVYGGYFEHRLLSPKRATMTHQRLVLGDIRIETGSYDFPVIAQGAMPAGSICIGLVADGADTTRYNTEPVCDDDIQVYAPGAELMYHAAGASRWINFTVANNVLQEIAQERIERPLEFPAHGIAAARLHLGARARLRQLADDTFALARALQPAGFGSELGREIARALAVAYVDALCGAEMIRRQEKKAAASRRYELILHCERLVLEGGLNDLDLKRLAQRSGYSLRSLELVFRDGVGMTPGRWFTNIRLNGALRDLIDPAPGCSVTSVARRWGFRHLSRFSGQYHEAFGELPSQTLSRSCAGRRIKPKRWNWLGLTA